MSDCIFCKIIKKEIPSFQIYEDDNFLAFLDVHPHAKGHTIIIPKNHARLISDLDEKKSGLLIPFIKNVMQLLKTKLNSDGFNVGWNNGEKAGQVVPHLHVHIMPRYSGDGGGSMHSIIKNPGELSVQEVAKLFK
ncbi:HIT family protein [Candidatus Woesearchaeota archaeon CG_4_10_14_0_2_um_filter_33_13]|nr:MAG: HIT family protein [Candidatus Woesearchaeota archaeon CG_4_10_14_0_2_um_filter_33_13]